MSEEEKKNQRGGIAGDQYGTFQGVANYPPPRSPQPPAIGFPQPVPPPGATESSAPPPPHYYAGGYQTVPGNLVI